MNPTSFPQIPQASTSTTPPESTAELYLRLGLDSAPPAVNPRMPSDDAARTDALVAALRTHVSLAMNERMHLRQKAALESAFQWYLSQSGQLMKTAEGSVWVEPSGLAHAVASEDFIYRLAELGKAPAGSNEVPKAIRAGAELAQRAGDGVLARRLILSGVGTDGATYLRRDDRTMFRVGLRAGDVVPNGTAGLVVVGKDTHEPISDLPPPRAPLLGWLIDLLSRVVRFRDLSPRQGGLVIALFLVYSLLPKERAGARPVCAILGEGASGKTTLIRGLMTWIWGRNAEVDAPPDHNAQRDIETMLARRAVYGIDDPDLSHSSTLDGLFRAVVTGADISRRKLYSDADVITYKPDVRLFIAANENPVASTYASTSRLLPIWLSRPNTHFREGQFEAAAAKSRPQFLADALDIHRLASPAAAASGNRRLAGFESNMLALAGVLGAEEEMRGALDALDGARQGLTLQEHQLGDALTGLFLPGSKWSGSASDLVDLLRGRSPANRRDPAWDGWTAARIGKQLSEIAPGMRASRGIEIRQVSRTGRSRGWVIEALPAAAASAPDGSTS